MTEPSPGAVTLTDGETTLTMTPAEWVGAALAHRQAEAERRRAERVELLVDLLFPKYDKRAVRAGKAQTPPIHPERDWWWNGASVETVEEKSDGFAEVTVESYVGDAEWDHWTVLLLPEWFSAEHPKPLVHAWIAEATEAKKKREHAERVRLAEAEARGAAERLAALRRQP